MAKKRYSPEVRYSKFSEERKARIDECLSWIGLQVKDHLIIRRVAEDCAVCEETARKDLAFAYEYLDCLDPKVYATLAAKEVAGQVFANPNATDRDKIAAAKLLLDAENRPQRIEGKLETVVNGKIDYRLTFEEANKVRSIYGLPEYTKEEWNKKEGVLK